MKSKKVRVRGVSKKGHTRKTDFSLQVLVNDDGVWFDQIYHGPGGEEKKLFLIRCSHRSARTLGEWLVDNLPVHA